LEVFTAANLDLIFKDDEVLESEEVEELNKDKSRAENRRNERLKKSRKKEQQTYVRNTDVCPKEKRMRKKQSVRKTRRQDDVGQFGSYKKFVDIHVQTK
jgi:hypothetical protein